MDALEIKLARKTLNMSQTEFGAMLGAKLRTVQSWESGERNMPAVTAILLKQKINAHKDAFSVIKENEEVYNIDVKHLDGYSSSIMKVPLVNQYAYAGYLNGFSDSEYLENLPTVPFVLDKEYRGQYLAFEVKGDSMECETDESIPEGSILLCRNVKPEYWRSKLHINKWDFVIVHKEMGIVVKRIIHHDVEKGIITLHSFNSFYSDYDVHLKDVQQIFNIVEVQTKRKRR